MPASAQQTRRNPVGWLTGPYRGKEVSPAESANSPRIYELLRAGNLYLSLSDAIALAIENNLDVQTARYQAQIAATDVLRSQGGGTLRGVGVVAFNLPLGVGGPASPLLNASASGAPPATAVPTDVFDLGFLAGSATTLSPDAGLTSSPLPSAAGPAIPQYDPSLTAGALWNKETTPQNSSVSTGNNVVTTSGPTVNLGLQQGFSTGTTYSLAYNTVNQNSSSLRNLYNPSTTGDLSLTVRQPLLRGFGPALNRRWIRIAKNDQKITDLVFRQDLINLVYGVSRLYYDLASLDEDLRVKRDTLSSAQELLKNTQAGVEEGTLAMVELTRARAQVAASEQDVINSQGLLDQQSALIKNVLTRKGSREAVIQGAPIIVTDQLTVPAENATPALTQLLAQADKLRPDLAAVALEITNTGIALEGTKNELLPQLDLVGIVESNALAGQSLPQSQTGLPPAAAYSGGYGTVLDQLFSHRYPGYQVGIQLTLPVRNRVAQADFTRDLIQKRAYETRLIQLQNQAALEIDNAMIALRRARAAYEAAVRTRILQQESLDVERARYEAGVDTAFFVIQYQAYLSQARSTEVAAKGDYFKALVGLNRSVGTLLDQNNISIDDANRGHVSTAPTPPDIRR